MSRVGVPAPIVILTTGFSTNQYAQFSKNKGFFDIHKRAVATISPDDGSWENVKKLTREQALAEVAGRGYRLVSTLKGSDQEYQYEYFFERQDGAAKAEDLRAELADLRARFTGQSADWERQAAVQQAECAQLSRDLQDTRAELEAERRSQVRAMAARDAALAAAQDESQQAAEAFAAKLAAKERTLADLRCEFEALGTELRAEMRRMADKAEAERVADVGVLQGRIASVVEEKEALKARLAVAEAFAPAVEEKDTLASDGTLVEKHIRVACPGTEPDQILIDPIPNGVAVQIVEKPDSASPQGPVFEKEFHYHHNQSRLELCAEESGLENGVLLLVLKRKTPPKLRLSHGTRSPLLAISEESAMQAEAGFPQTFVMSRSPSESTISTISSKWVLAESGDNVVAAARGQTADPDARAADDAGQSTAAPPPTVAGSSSAEGAGPTASATSAPAELPTRQCFLPSTRLLLEDGGAVEAARLLKGDRLCALSGEGDAMTFNTAVVRSVCVLAARERDIATITLAGCPGMEVSLTTTHSLLACQGGEEQQWCPVEAADLRADGHRLFIMRRGGGLEPPPEWEACVGSVGQRVESCEVVEMVLEDAADAVFAALAEDDVETFAAVFGCPARPAMKAVLQHGFIDVRPEHGKDLAVATRSSFSDPSHSTAKRAPVYRSIRRPHDEHCTAWCKFYFKEEGCKWGKTCSSCHDESHRGDGRRARTHRGKRR